MAALPWCVSAVERAYRAANVVHVEEDRRAVLAGEDGVSDGHLLASDEGGRVVKLRWVDEGAQHPASAGRLPLRGRPGPGGEPFVARLSLRGNRCEFVGRVGTAGAGVLGAASRPAPGAGRAHEASLTAAVLPSQSGPTQSKNGVSQQLANGKNMLLQTV